MRKANFVSSCLNPKRTLSDFGLNLELGFLSLLRLVECEYFRRCEFEFKDACPDMTPESVLRKLAKDHSTDLETHSCFIIAIREALFNRCYEVQNLPTVEALRYHWLRSCWVCQVYAQADKKSTVNPPLTEFG